MANKKSPSLDTTSLLTALKQVTKPIKAHHALILFLLLMSVIIYSVISVNSIMQINDDTQYRSSADAKSLTPSFDQATIKKVDDLRQSNDNTNITLPGGRRNPFVD